MEGTILGWSSDSREGVIKSASGDRYNFTKADWKSEQEPKNNAKVDFNVQGDRALEVYLLSTSNFNGTLEKAKSGLSQASSTLSSNDMFRRLTEHGLHNIVPAVMMLLALLFSLGDYKFNTISMGSAFLNATEGVSVTDGFIGFVFIIAALGFIALAILGIKPLIMRVLGGLVSVILLVHLLSIPLIALEALDAGGIEDIVFHIIERLSIFMALLLLAGLVLAVVATILPKEVNPNFASEKELQAAKTKGEAVVAQDDADSNKEQNLAHINYALLALFPFTIIGGIVGVIFAYVRRGQTENELYKDHCRYIIRTFWFTVLWFIVSLVTAFILIGLLFAFILSIWFFYRVIKGWLRLANKQKMYK